MNNHRPRKAVMHPGHYMNQANNFYGMNGTGTDHAREINKVRAPPIPPLSGMAEKNGGIGKRR